MRIDGYHIGMILRIEISFAGYRSGSVLRDDEFLSQLRGIERYPVVRSAIPGGTCRVVFLTEKYDVDAISATEEDPGMRADAFAEKIQQTLAAITDWLRLQPVTHFEIFDQSGIHLHLFIDMWIDQDQMDLSIPPPLMLECGLRGISVEVYSND